MNLMSIKSHCFCLRNSFLKKLTLQYYSVVVLAVPPEEIGRGSFTTVSSLSISLMLSLSEKANCDVSPLLYPPRRRLIGRISDVV
jgi:hypothetical protein